MACMEEEKKRIQSFYFVGKCQGGEYLENVAFEEGYY